MIVGMPALNENLGALASGLGRLFAFPTKVLLVLAGGVVGVLGILLTVLITSSGASTVTMVIFGVLWLLLVIPVVLFAVRRRRWLVATQQGTPPAAQIVMPGSSTSTELQTVDLTSRVQEEMRGREGEDDVRALFDAMTESRAPGSDHGTGARVTRVFSIGRLSPIGRALGGIDRAQRGLLTAAGGPVNAPYLKDDLRISAAALAGTLIAIPVGALAVIILALVLLTQ